MMLICCVSAWNSQPICFPVRHHLLLKQPPQMSNVHIILVKDTYVSTIWYTCSFDGPGQPPQKKTTISHVPSLKMCFFSLRYCDQPYAWRQFVWSRHVGWIQLYTLTPCRLSVLLQFHCWYGKCTSNKSSLYIYIIIYIHKFVYISLIPEAPQVLGDALCHLCRRKRTTSRP